MTADEQQPKKSRRTCLRWTFRLAAAGFAAVLLGAIAVGAALVVAYQHVQRQGLAGEVVEVEIPKGASGADTAAILAEKGLIEHELFFRLALRLDESGEAIQAGTYELPRGLSAQQLLALIHEGPDTTFDPSAVPAERRLAVPEGLTIAQMAELRPNPSAFIEAARTSPLIQELNPGGASLEGYLMPSTYFFDTPPTDAMALEAMAAQFRKVWDGLAAKYPDRMTRPQHEILTVASLVEEEARSDDERPVIAAVIYNRLERGMTLDMDSTLQYALGKYGQRLLNRDKEVASPYNTYRNAGLPPGPISNPGPASIEAALAPAVNDYLYFVSNADGKTHTFSRTLAEHNEAVARFRREIAEQRRALQNRESADGPTQ